jgi:hypothetical protein
LLGSAEAAAAQRREEGEGAGQTSFGCGPKESGRERGEKKPFSFYIFTNLLQIQTNLNSKPHQLTPQPNKDIYAPA